MQIARATAEIAICGVGSAHVSSCQTSATSEGNRLPTTVSNFVYDGAYSYRGDEIANAIDALVIPVHRCSAAANNDFSEAQALITRIRNSMIPPDRAHHAAMAAAAAAAAAARG